MYSNAISPMKLDEDASRISFMQNLQQRVIELEQIIEEKNSIIDHQKNTIVELKNKQIKALTDACVQATENDFIMSTPSIGNQ